VTRITDILKEQKDAISVSLEKTLNLEKGELTLQVNVRFSLELMEEIRDEVVATTIIQEAFAEEIVSHIRRELMQRFERRLR